MICPRSQVPPVVEQGLPWCPKILRPGQLSIQASGPCPHGQGLGLAQSSAPTSLTGEGSLDSGGRVPGEDTKGAI